MAKKTATAAAPQALLVELLTEELPPKSLRALSESFGDALLSELVKRKYLAKGASIRTFATPRRIAVRIEGVSGRSPDELEERKGPARKDAYDASGNPTEKLLGFLRKHGAGLDSLRFEPLAKGEVAVISIPVPGRPLDEVLGGMVEAALRALPVQKAMRWGSGEAQFVRPVHGLVMLHGPRLVPGKVLGVESSNRTLGHRFLCSGAITLEHADDYERALRDKGKVIADFAARRSALVAQLEQAAGAGATPVADEALLEEITALVEAPAVYAGNFDPGFLAVPEECLILSMQQHQRYVPLRENESGRLLPRFLFVSNIATKRPQEIVRGNERVLRARLADARFFYDQDRKTRLEARVPRLASVVYHGRLGSQLERVERLQLMAGRIARDLGADPLLAERAAWLSKADLLTEMVGEFPELQGVMGAYYARHDGEPREVADALADQYRLRYEESRDPANGASASLYLADRIEQIVGLFGIGEKPTGEKDPFGLRRAALGIISAYESLAQAGRRLPEVRELLEHCVTLFPAGRIAAGTAAEAHEFILDRCRHRLAEAFPRDAVEAVVGLRPPLAEALARVRAVEEFRRLPEAASLAAANKRIRNILRKSEANSAPLDESLLSEPAERALHAALRETAPRVAARVEAGDYTGAMQAMAALKAPVDAFFDRVLVNAEDERLRANRHALLRELDSLMNRVADISKLAA
ncbi:MAG TPA: glycine--tRNA ligase subunit beta [Burkholderiales bacterium]|nr:glycine--tRNA ligase subunit beta [Burkholderiales bacterium]